MPSWPECQLAVTYASPLALRQPRRAGGALLGLAGVALFAAHPSLFSREALYPTVTAILFAGVLLSVGAHQLTAGPAASGVSGSSGSLQSPRLLGSALLWTSGLFAFTVLLSAVVNSGPAWGRIWLPAAQILYVWLGCWLAADERVLAHLGSVLLLLASAAGVYALVQHLGLDPLPSGTVFEDRIVSVFDNPNHLGSCMAVALPLALHCFLTRASLKRLAIWPYGAVIAMYTGLLLAGSRGAWWACLAGCGLLMAGYVRSVRRGDLILRWRHLLLLGLSLCLVTSVLSKTQIMKGSGGEAVSMSARLRSSTNVVGPSAANDSTVNHRYFLWHVAVNMIRERPLVGLGYGSYRVQYPRFRDRLRQEPQFQHLSWLQQRYIPQYAHDEYLQRWAESGVFALLSFLALVGLGMAAALKAGWRGCGGLRPWALLGSLVALLIHAIVSYPFHMAVSGTIFWILLGIIYYPGRFPEIDKQEEYLLSRGTLHEEPGTK